MPNLRTWKKRGCKVGLKGPKANFSSLGGGGIPLEPAARPFLNFLMGRMTSSTVGSSALTFGSGTAEMDSDSKDVEVVAGR